MTKSETIQGDVLTFEEHPEYKGEYIAKWKDYIVAIVMEQPKGHCSITAFHPDGMSTMNDAARDLKVSWQRIKTYLQTGFINEMSHMEEQSYT